MRWSSVIFFFFWNICILRDVKVATNCWEEIHVEMFTLLTYVSWDDDNFLSKLWASYKSLIITLPLPSNQLENLFRAETVLQKWLLRISRYGERSQKSPLFELDFSKLNIFSLSLMFVLPVLVQSKTMQKEVAHLNTRVLSVPWYSEWIMAFTVSETSIRSMELLEIGLLRKAKTFLLQQWILPSVYLKGINSDGKQHGLVRLSVWSGVLAEEPKALTVYLTELCQCELFMVFTQQPGVPCPENSSPCVSIKQILRRQFPGRNRISIQWWLLELGEDLESGEKLRVEKILSLPDFPGKLKAGISRDPNRAAFVLQEPRHAGCCWCALTGATYGHCCFRRLWMCGTSRQELLWKLEGRDRLVTTCKM